jgi:hypothetical protein
MILSNARYLIAAACVVAGVVSWFSERDRSPTPAPPEPESFSLRGKFVGPSAADDAACLFGLTSSLADILEWDGMQANPRIVTGVQVDDLRRAAREMRLRGESIGDRQPAVREAVHKYLDENAGTSGGPIGPQERSAWVAAFREIGRAAADVAR